MQPHTKEKQRFLAYLKTALGDSLMDEVSATPKPGLVDLHDSGAHTDMDFQTFKYSTEAIVPWLFAMAQQGSNWSHLFKERGSSSGAAEAEALFLSLRPMGLAAEQAMFAATGGVNTHKGMIFSMGLVSAAAGFIFSKGGTLRAENLLDFAKMMCAEPLKADFAAISFDNPKTHGERLYVKYGCLGIRGEAAGGFPSVREVSLPIIKEVLRQFPSGDWNRICLQTLLKLMEHVDDTNVLFRTDYTSLLYVKEKAGEILTLGGSFTDSGIAALRQLNEDFILKNISPGGCADLLAITLFLWRLEQYKP